MTQRPASAVRRWAVRQAALVPLLDRVVRRRRERYQREHPPVLRPPKPAQELRRVRTPPSAATEALELELERITAGGGPIVAGPWTGSRRDELLLWLPFLRWVRERYRLEPTRLSVVAAASSADWYTDVAPVAATGNDAVAARLGPGLFASLVERFMLGEAPLLELLDRLVYRRLAAPRGSRPSADPLVTVAGPLDADLAAAIRADGVTLVEMPAERAAAADAVIAGAALHIGPVDEHALVALSHGTPTVSVYDEPAAVASADVDLVYRAARRLGTPFVIVAAPNAALLAHLASRAERRPTA